jgi:hypothetical protein
MEFRSSGVNRSELEMEGMNPEWNRSGRLVLFDRWDTGKLSDIGSSSRSIM